MTEQPRMNVESFNLDHRTVAEVVDVVENDADRLRQIAEGLQEVIEEVELHGRSRHQ